MLARVIFLGSVSRAEFPWAWHAHPFLSKIPGGKRNGVIDALLLFFAGSCGVQPLGMNPLPAVLVWKLEQDMDAATPKSKGGGKQAGGGAGTWAKEMRQPTFKLTQTRHAKQ